MRYHVTIETIDGTEIERREISDGELFIGRGSDADIRLNASDVSRRHARIFVHLGRCYIEDLGSANGVVLDGRRIRGIEQIETPAALVVGIFVMRVTNHLNFVVSGGMSDSTAPAPIAWQPTIVYCLEGQTPVVAPLRPMPAVVGRGSSADIVIADSSVSRQHCRITSAGDEISIADLGSSNGSFLNGEPLKRSCVLRDGDKLQFGDVPAIYTGFPDQVRPEMLVSSTAGPSTASKWLPIGALALSVLGVLTIVAMLLRDNNQREAEPPETTRANADPLVTRQPVDAESTRPDPASTADCEAKLQQVTTLEAAGALDDALALTIEADRCLRAATRAGSESAENLRDTLAVPTQIALHQRAGALALAERNYADSVRHFQEALRQHLGRPEVDQALSDMLKGQTRQALWSQGDAAAAAQDWSAAVEAYRHAAGLRTLDASEQSTLDDALRQAQLAP